MSQAQHHCAANLCTAGHFDFDNCGSGYGGTAAFNAGVGERARADARIILQGIRTTTTEVRTRESNYVVWQKMLNQGSVSETLTMPSFSGPTQPSFSAPGGLSVQKQLGQYTR